MRPEIFVTRAIPEEGLELLREAGFEVEVNPEDRPLTHAELVEAVRGRKGLLCLLSDRMDAEVLEAARGARGIALYAVGYDNVDLETAARLGIPVTNTPGVLTVATAELAWALLFAAARRVVEADRYLREGRWTGWGPMLLRGFEVSGRTLGVVGAGRIGETFALGGKGFGMRVLYCDPSPNVRLESELGARRVPLPELLAESDFVSLHLPYTPRTHHLIGAAELGLMKPTAVLINTARGKVVDEAALETALARRAIGAAGLDVYEDEPHPRQGLLALDNAVLLPHIASATYPARGAMAVMAAKNLLCMLRGEEPPDLVQP